MSTKIGSLEQELQTSYDRKLEDLKNWYIQEKDKIKQTTDLSPNNLKKTNESYGENKLCHVNEDEADRLYKASMNYHISEEIKLQIRDVYKDSFKMQTLIMLEIREKNYEQIKKPFESIKEPLLPQQQIEYNADKISEFICNGLIDELKSQLFPQRSSSLYMRFSTKFSDEQYIISHQRNSKKYRATESAKNTRISIGDDSELSFTKSKNLQGVRTSFQVVEAYINNLCNDIFENPKQFIESLAIPLNRNPLFILGKIQNEAEDYFEAIEPVSIIPILEFDTYLRREKLQPVTCLNEVPVTEEQKHWLEEWTSIHNKAIFDSFNDALDYFRSYGVNGPPLPWSLQTRELTYKNGTVNSIQDVLGAAREKVLHWARGEAGALQVPDKQESVNIFCGFSSTDNELEKNFEAFREEKLKQILAEEVYEFENSWMDCELEQTQVVIDISDSVLAKLAEETAALLLKLQSR